MLSVHGLSKLEIKSCYLVSSEVRSKFDIDGASSIRNRPLRVMILLISPLADLITEVLTLLKGIKVKFLRHRVLCSIPSIIATTVESASTVISA